MGKDLIIATAYDLSFKHIRLFLGSLKQTNFKGDVCLFVSRMNAVDRNILYQYGVRIIAFKKRFPYIKDPSKIDASSVSARYPKSRFKEIPMLSLRFIMYYLYLAKWKNEYSRVLLTDVTDVVFQKDPFDFEFDDNLLYCFLENRTRKIGSCVSNSAWVRSVFGEKVLNEIGANNIACAGVIAGSTDVVTEYLKSMIDCMMQFKKVHPSLIGDDQAIHNYLIYKKQPKYAKLVYNETGPVMHMHYVPKDSPRFNNDGLLINDKGDVVNIVHQYNRHPLLEKKYQERYSIPRLPTPLHLTISAGIYEFLRNLRLLYRIVIRSLLNFTHPLRHRVRLCTCYLHK